MPTNGFSINPPKIKLLAGEQKSTELLYPFTLAQPMKDSWCDEGPNVHLRFLLRQTTFKSQPKLGVRHSPPLYMEGVSHVAFLFLPGSLKRLQADLGANQERFFFSFTLQKEATPICHPA